MNKPLIAAISGVIFGATIVGAALHQRAGCHSRCNRTVTVEHVVYSQPAAHPPCPAMMAMAEMAQEAEANEDSACPRLVDEPLESGGAQLTAAQTEYVRGNFSCAAAVARKAVKQEPARAYRILGAAACNSHDIAGVADADAHLDASGRQYLQYVCNRAGVIHHGHRWFFHN